MKFPPDIRVYGDQKFRGECPSETLEQVTFFARLRKLFPETLGMIAIHIRNEGHRTVMQAAREKSEGMTTGAADIIIPGRPSFVCELKRRDHTKSKISEDQIKYLRATAASGSFTCIALGVDAAWEALIDWINVATCA